jgi:hypothetical protein
VIPPDRRNSRARDRLSIGPVVTGASLAPPSRSHRSLVFAPLDELRPAREPGSRSQAHRQARSLRPHRSLVG